MHPLTVCEARFGQKYVSSAHLKLSSLQIFNLSLEKRQKWLMESRLDGYNPPHLSLLVLGCFPQKARNRFTVKLQKHYKH